MTNTTTTIKKGQAQQLYLIVDPVDGDISSLAYSVPNNAVTFSPNTAGGTVNGAHPTPTGQTAPVIASVQSTDDAGNPITITAECDVTVTPPPVKGLTLSPTAP